MLLMNDIRNMNLPKGDHPQILVPRGSGVAERPPAPETLIPLPARPVMH